MTGESRLAEIVSALREAGIVCLVMGGHAVRYYGLERYTNDFDLHLAPEIWDDLVGRLPSKRLLRSGFLQEGTSWRPRDFRRFRIGTLPNGQEEWLEFWRANHLLAPFAELWERREEGTQALLLPFAPAAAELPKPDIPIEPIVLERLRTTPARSPLHFALVEIVRRQRRQVRQAADRADKDSIRTGQQGL